MNKRFFLAILIAPSVYGVLFLFLSIVKGNLNDGLWGMSFILMFSYPLTIVLGFSAYFLLEKIKKTSLGIYISTSIFLSIIPLLYFVVYPKIVCFQDGYCLEWYSVSMMQQLAVVFLGILTTVASFWLIARPDKYE